MSHDTLGTKQTCPDCGAKFYDLGALDISCPKCDYAFAPEDFEGAKKVEVAPAPVPVKQEEPKKKAKIEVEDETDETPVKSCAMLESDDDYPDIDHLEEVEDHFEASEVDVNSDDADDEMFMEELDHGEVALLSEFEHVDADGYRPDL